MSKFVYFSRDFICCFGLVYLCSSSLMGQASRLVGLPVRLVHFTASGPMQMIGTIYYLDYNSPRISVILKIMFIKYPSLPNQNTYFFQRMGSTGPKDIGSEFLKCYPLVKKKSFLILLSSYTKNLHYYILNESYQEFINCLPYAVWEYDFYVGKGIIILCWPIYES